MIFGLKWLGKLALGKIGSTIFTPILLALVAGGGVLGVKGCTDARALQQATEQLSNAQLELTTLQAEKTALLTANEGLARELKSKARTTRRHRRLMQRRQHVNAKHALAPQKTKGGCMNYLRNLKLLVGLVSLGLLMSCAGTRPAGTAAHEVTDNSICPPMGSLNPYRATFDSLLGKIQRAMIVNEDVDAAMTEITIALGSAYASVDACRAWSRYLQCPESTALEDIHIGESAAISTQLK